MLTKDEREWIDCHFTKLNELITKLRVDVAVLKVKAGIWGLLGGMIPIAIYLILKNI